MLKLCPKSDIPARRKAVTRHRARYKLDRRPKVDLRFRSGGQPRSHRSARKTMDPMELRRRGVENGGVGDGDDDEDQSSTHDDEERKYTTALKYDSTPPGANCRYSCKLTLDRRDLEEHHVNMIAFSACLGVGLFLQAGRVVALAGPGMAVICYILVGSIMWSMMACLGEMTALFPIQGE